MKPYDREMELLEPRRQTLRPTEPLDEFLPTVMSVFIGMLIASIVYGLLFC